MDNNETKKMNKKHIHANVQQKIHDKTVEDNRQYTTTIQNRQWSITIERNRQ